ncbi:hypothetical protein TNCV_2806681 [Trichonephila clavipes]|nr:hypothetical protein TNCV_2806681 [Trichonephila clavipes]
MTSTTDWSERTDDTEKQPPISPPRMIAGDDHIAECSDLFREAIQARNVYAAWARKLTNARPNDPKLQSYHQEVTKAGYGNFGKELGVLVFILNSVPQSDEAKDIQAYSRVQWGKAAI